MENSNVMMANQPVNQNVVELSVQREYLVGALRYVNPLADTVIDDKMKKVLIIVENNSLRVAIGGMHSSLAIVDIGAINVSGSCAAYIDGKDVLATITKFSSKDLGLRIDTGKGIISLLSGRHTIGVTCEIISDSMASEDADEDEVKVMKYRNAMLEELRRAEREIESGGVISIVQDDFVDMTKKLEVCPYKVDGNKYVKFRTYIENRTVTKDIKDIQAPYLMEMQNGGDLVKLVLSYVKLVDKIDAEYLNWIGESNEMHLRSKLDGIEFSVNLNREIWSDYEDKLPEERRTRKGAIVQVEEPFAFIEGIASESYRMSLTKKRGYGIGFAPGMQEMSLEMNLEILKRVTAAIEGVKTTKIFNDQPVRISRGPSEMCISIGSAKFFSSISDHKVNPTTEYFNAPAKWKAEVEVKEFKLVMDLLSRRLDNPENSVLSDVKNATEIRPNEKCIRFVSLQNSKGVPVDLALEYELSDKYADVTDVIGFNAPRKYIKEALGTIDAKTKKVEVGIHITMVNARKRKRDGQLVVDENGNQVMEQKALYLMSIMDPVLGENGINHRIQIEPIMQ